MGDELERFNQGTHSILFRSDVSVLFCFVSLRRTSQCGIALWPNSFRPTHPAIGAWDEGHRRVPIRSLVQLDRAHEAALGEAKTSLSFRCSATLSSTRWKASFWMRSSPALGENVAVFHPCSISNTDFELPSQNQGKLIQAALIF